MVKLIQMDSGKRKLIYLNKSRRTWLKVALRSGSLGETGLPGQTKQ
jgi:hypothetical protein